MVSFPAKFRLILLSLSFLTFHIEANLKLSRSDSEALFLLSSNLGFNLRLNQSDFLCNSVDIICEARMSHETPVLRVTRIIFDSKRLKGSLSPVIGWLTELKELSLPNNHLVDRIPLEIVDCKHLEVLNLRNNTLSGQIPPDLSSFVSLRTLDLSFNQFSGNLNFLNNFPKLEKLYLSDNLFSGKIPISIRTFRNLRFVDLLGNIDLQDSVPKSLNLVKEIQYPLPKRYIFAENRTRNRTSFALLSPAPSPLPTPHQPKKDDRNLRGRIIGFFAGLFAGLVSGFVFSLLFKLLLACVKGRVSLKESGPVIYSPLIKKAEDLAFLEQEDGLSPLEIIGRGGCGEVYRKELEGYNGKIFAIKKIIQPAGLPELNEEDSKNLTKKMRQVRSEIQTVGQIRHRNLLPLLAHVPRPECQYLVYEFMRNGSLHDIQKQISEGNGELAWSLRHKIALGIAAGLEYLHMHHSPRVIHRDLKPANILIDDDMEARIADFGLAATMPDYETHVTTSNVAGTVGYIAPEYHQTLKFTDKCDIYSFGVVLAGLVMGKFPSDEFFQHTDEMSLVKWLRNVLVSDNPCSAIDPNLIGNGYEEQMLLVLKIAVFCTLDDPKQRPDSKDVYCMLSQVKH